MASGPQASYIGWLIDTYALTRYCEVQMRVLTPLSLKTFRQNNRPNLSENLFCFGLHLMLGKITIYLKKNSTK